jgi:hypothetical protein
MRDKLHPLLQIPIPLLLRAGCIRAQMEMNCTPLLAGPSIECADQTGGRFRCDPGTAINKSIRFGGAESIAAEELVLDAPYSHFTETLRNLKALINPGLGDGVNVIGIVSSVPKEGKTTIAANLAALIIASSGARTLIIDSDVHLRQLTAKLAPHAREGLIEALIDPSRLATLVSKRQALGARRLAVRSLDSLSYSGHPRWSRC